jgi:outer membrane protein assembly factor BamD
MLYMMAFLMGCSSVRVHKDAKENDIYGMAESLIEKGKYDNAIEVLKELINRYPASPLLEKAYFEIARAYYLDEENVDAEVAFDDFIRLYPESSLVPQGILLKGMTIERNIEKPGLDQTPTVEAIETYRELVRKYPRCDEAKKAMERIEKLENHLAKHELSIAAFYLKIKHYSSAEVRLKKAFQKYSDTETGSKIISLLVKSYILQGKKDEATKLLKYMMKYYPGNEDAIELEKIISGEK